MYNKFVLSTLAVLFSSLFFLNPKDAYATVTLEVGIDQTYTTIQAAVDAIPSTLSEPYVVNIHAETYRSSTNPIVNIANKTTSTTNTITLQANGSDLVILDGEHARRAIISNVHNVTIRGLQIKNATDHGILIGTTACDNDQILNNDFINSTGAGDWRGLTVIECNNVTIKNNTFYQYGVNGLWNGGADNTVIDGNTFYRTTSNAVLVNTFSTVSSNMIFKNNIISTCGSSGAACTNVYGFNIAAGSSATLSNNNIYNYATGATTGTFTDGGGNIATDPSFLSTDLTSANFLFIDPISSSYTGGIGGTPLGGRYVAPPSNLRQFRANGSDSQIATGTSTNETALVLKADLATSVYAATLTPEIEVKPINEAFDGVTELIIRGSSNYIGTAVTNINELSCLNKNLYHWRVRVRNENNIYSSWTSFGGNNETSADFIIDNNCSVETSGPTLKEGYLLNFNLGDSSQNLEGSRFFIKGEEDPKTLLMVNKNAVALDTLAIVKKISLKNLLSGNNPDLIKYANPSTSGFLPVGDYWDFRLYNAQNGAGFINFGDNKSIIQIPYDQNRLNQIIQQSNGLYSARNLKILALDKIRNRWIVLPNNAPNLSQQTIANVVRDLTIYVVAIIP